VPSGKKSREARRKASAPAPPQASRPSSKKLAIALAVTLSLAGVAAGLVVVLRRGGNATASSRLAALSTLGPLVAPRALGPAGPEGPPIEPGPALAPAAAPSPGTTVDGIQCQPAEQVLFHIHARLTVYVHGQPERVPYGIGIADPQTDQTPAGPFVVAGTCFAWLHTHAADGIIHIESPVERTYTLGNFFDIWHQPLDLRQVGPAKGRVTALVDGKVWKGNPRTIPLDAHTQIQLDAGRPLVAPTSISNWNHL
jgi:hypothetical protein